MLTEHGEYDNEVQGKLFVITGLKLRIDTRNNSRRDSYGVLDPKCDDSRDCTPDVPVCLASAARNTDKIHMKADTKGVPSLEPEKQEAAVCQSQEHPRTKLARQKNKN